MTMSKHYSTFQNNCQQQFMQSPVFGCDSIGMMAQAKEEVWEYALPTFEDKVASVGVGILRRKAFCNGCLTTTLLFYRRKLFI